MKIFYILDLDYFFSNSELYSPISQGPPPFHTHAAWLSSHCPGCVTLLRWLVCGQKTENIVSCLVAGEATTLLIITSYIVCIIINKRSRYQHETQNMKPDPGVLPQSSRQFCTPTAKGFMRKSLSSVSLTTRNFSIQNGRNLKFFKEWITKVVKYLLKSSELLLSLFSTPSECI